MSARPRWRGIARALGARPSSIRFAATCTVLRDGESRETCPAPWRDRVTTARDWLALDRRRCWRGAQC